MNVFHRLTDLIRAGDWWIYKVSPIVATGIATSLLLGKSPVSMIGTLALLLVAISLVATFASLINDTCDIEEDRIAGKSNQMADKSRLYIAAIISICLGCGGLALSQFSQSVLAQVVYISNWAIFALYSIPPVRLKNRGLLGVVAMGLGECMLPHLFAVLLVCLRADLAIPTSWLSLMAIWSFSAGLRGILWHQLKDFENDRMAGVRTLAATASTQRLLFAARWFIFPVEISGFAAVLWLQNEPALWILMAVYLLTDYFRWKLWHTPVVIVSPLKHDRLLLFEYYDCFYILGLCLVAARREALNLILLPIVIAFYGRRIGWWWRDVRALIGH